MSVDINLRSETKKLQFVLKLLSKHWLGFGLAVICCCLCCLSMLLASPIDTMTWLRRRSMFGCLYVRENPINQTKWLLCRSILDSPLSLSLALKVVYLAMCKISVKQVASQCESNTSQSVILQTTALSCFTLVWSVLVVLFPSRSFGLVLQPTLEKKSIII